MIPYLVNLLGFFVFSQLGFHFWPEWSVINGIRIDYLSPTLYVFDVIFILIWMLNSITPRPPLNLRGGVRRTRVILIIFIVLNVFFALSPLNSIFKWLRIYECFWLYQFFSKNLKYFKNLFLGFFVGIIFVSFLTVAQFVKGSSLGGIWYWMGERNFSLSTPGISKIYLKLGIWDLGIALRPYATFPHPNVLAGVFMITSILLLNTKNKILKTVGVLEWVIIFLTFSRTIIFLQIFILSLFAIKYQKKLVFLIIPLTIFLFVNHPNSLIERSTQISDFLKHFEIKNIFGWGLGNSIYYFSKYLFQIQPIHNIYLLIISETGLLFPLFMFWTFFKKIRIGLHSGNLWRNVFLITVFASGMTDHYWWTSPQAQIALSICLPFALKLGSERN